MLRRGLAAVRRTSKLPTCATSIRQPPRSCAASTSGGRNDATCSVRLAPVSHRKRSSETAANVKKWRSEEHTSELQSLMRISYAGFCLKKKKTYSKTTTHKTKEPISTQTHTNNNNIFIKQISKNT